MQWGKKLTTAACAMTIAVAGLGLSTAGPAEAAAARYKCKVKVGLDHLSRPVAYTACAKSKSGKKVRRHRAEITCDQVTRDGHDTRWTLHGPWVTPGKKSKVHCGFKNTLVGGDVQTK